MNGRKLVPGIVSILLVIASIPALLGERRGDTIQRDNDVSSSAFHSPIYILGDTNLDNFCSGNGTNGSSWEYAHVIRDYEFNITSSYGIYIELTTRYLKIINCSFVTIEAPTAIGLDTVQHVKVINCSFSGQIFSGAAFSTSHSSDIEVTNCTFDIDWKPDDSSFYQDSSIPIQFGTCQNITLHHNNLTSTQEKGIIFSKSTNVNISYNNLINCSIRPKEMDYRNFTVIFENNSINGRDLLVYSNTTGLTQTDFINAGEIILLNCNNSLISNQDIVMILATDSHSNDFLNNTGSIWLDRCNDNFICNNSGKNGSVYSIYLNASSNNQVISNNASRSLNTGIALSKFSSHNIIINNTANHGYTHGIVLGIDCNYNLVENNDVFFSKIGIKVIFGEWNDIIHNSFRNNSRYGVLLDDGAFGNDVILNHIAGNEVSNAMKSAFIQTNANLWDNDSSGNYWGDYLENYPTATNDGVIWNQGYEVNGSNDQYPLVTPFTPDLAPSVDIILNNASRIFFTNETLEFLFSGNPGNTPSTISWDFCDGSPSVTGLQVQHTYTIAGNYSVNVTVTDLNGDSSEGTSSFEIIILLPSGDDDGDGYSNIDEISQGHDPLDPNDHPPSNNGLPGPEIGGVVILIIAISGFSALAISGIVYSKKR
ncbi:MAG: right-handed parallel beta-helix repeat-containing protein [Candidatus Hodarchaeota archaeon]